MEKLVIGILAHVDAGKTTLSEGISLTVSISASIFTFQYGYTLIRSLSPPEIVENTALHSNMVLL